MDDNAKINATIAKVFEDMAHGLKSGSFGEKIKVGLTVFSSEHGPSELLAGARLAAKNNSHIEVVLIGKDVNAEPFPVIEAQDEQEAHAKMDDMLLNGQLHAAVTMHYNFPIGVSTVGQVITPGKGKPMFLASTTGTSATNRGNALLKNTILGIAVAKACGIENPTVGILNLDGANKCHRDLLKLQEKGYPIHFTQSARADGGVVMRGNDLLMGVPELMVQDSLSGNVLMKVFSAFNTGGSYEALGYGYGPGVGEGYDRIIGIISRASGAPVVAGAIAFMAACAQGKLLEKVDAEFKAAHKAGLAALLAANEASAKEAAPKATLVVVAAPPKKVVTESISGVEVMEIEAAVEALWKAGIYAESGMGCTGPIVMVAPEDLDAALKLLAAQNYR